jgi:hypothetical protein
VGPLPGLPTVFKSEAFPASDFEASLAGRCRAEVSRVTTHAKPVVRVHLLAFAL